MSLISTWIMCENRSTSDTTSLGVLGDSHGDHTSPVPPVIVETVARDESEKQVEDGDNGTELNCVTEGPGIFMDAIINMCSLWTVDY